VAPAPGDSPRADGSAETVQFGSGRSARHGVLVSRALLVGLVLATVVVVAVRHDGQARHPAARPPAPAIRVIAVGHPILDVTATWQLFARGADELVRIELAAGRVTLTHVPPLETANPDVAFLVGAHEVIISSADLVPGYVVPDGGQARQLSGPLAGGGPLVPGPAGQGVWVSTGSPTRPALALLTLAGRRSGPVISFPPDGPLLWDTAVSDGHGGVLVEAANMGVYDVGPAGHKPVPGSVIAVGPSDWLVVVCGADGRHCHNAVVNSHTGAGRLLPGPAAAFPYYFSWPPSGVISPDGSTAAIAETGSHGQLTVRLISMTSGASRAVRILAGSSLPAVTGLGSQSMVWSPDSRWLFVAAGGRLVAVSRQLGRAESLGVTLPPVAQVAIRD
jgi:hypothetical protein